MRLRILNPTNFLILFLIRTLRCDNTPCDFNTMCLCWLQDDSDFMKMDINCMGVAFAKFPDVSVSYVAQLDIVNSGIQVLDNDALASLVDVEALGLMNNRLMSISDKAFSGIVDSLRSLDLSYNELEEMPVKAIRELKKLNWLNLHSNHLTSLEGDWGYAKDTLVNAFFGDNSIAEIPKNFASFKNLVWLNLDNNNIQDVAETSLPPMLQTLSLNNNLLKVFPMSLSNLQHLTWLHLRGNEIQSLEMIDFRSSNLQLIDVSENCLETFHFLGYANRTFYVQDLNLASNKLASLPADLFKYMEVKRIHLSSNEISAIDDDAFRGLEDVLEYLNLEKNDLSTVPAAVSQMKKLSYLYLANNDIHNISGESFLQFSEHLRALSLATNHLVAVPVAALSKCHKMLHLNLGYNKISQVEPGDFDWAESLEILLLRNNFLSRLKGNSFRGASNLKELSLSFNQLTELDDEAFHGVNSSLEILELSFAFSTDVFPQKAFRPLTNLLWLVLDNNNFHTIESSAFYTFHQLRYVNLESNRLHYLPDRLFLPSVHPELRDVKLGYNFLEALPDSTFHNLTELRSLDLTGNRIRILPSTFIENCPKLLTLSLAYNKIDKIDKYAFRGLTNLRFLHLEFNRLTHLDMDAFLDTGGPEFSLNVSFNAIAAIDPGFSVTNLTRLSLGYNNFSALTEGTFAATPNLRFLDLRNNFLTILDADIFKLEFLEKLNIKNNQVEVLRRRTFHDLKILQQLDLSNNALTQLLSEQFRHNKKLRVLNLSKNQLRSLPRDVFKNTNLEILDLSENKFTAIPSAALLEVGYILRDLNIADNYLDRLDSTSLPTSQLTRLNIAKNRITILPDNSFDSLGNLLSLNVSQNVIQANFKELFHYLPDLRRLYMTNCGLNKVPLLPLTKLNVYDMSFNSIVQMTGKELQFLENLKVLSLTNNSLTSMPTVHVELLRELDVSWNPINILQRENFQGYPRLEKLNLMNLNKARSIDTDIFRNLRFLKHLRIQSWPESSGFHLRNLLSGLPLRTVEIQMMEPVLRDQIQNVFNKQLRELTITGQNLEAIAPDAFTTIEGSELVLRIKDTRVRKLQSDIFLTLTKHFSELTLDLRNNHINELSPSVIYGNLSWETVGTNMVAGGLQVSGNPLECDCEIAWLSLWLRRWLRESRQIHTASQSDARQLRTIAGRAVCTETTPSYSSDKVLLTLGTPHTACQASALSSANHKRFAKALLTFVELVIFLFVVN